MILPQYNPHDNYVLFNCVYAKMNQTCDWGGLSMKSWYKFLQFLFLISYNAAQKSR